ncbi:MAG: response regulator transcription factor, partial [Chitinispirillaceae bacterium]|nr:response regulator transcription factor [Chitinispirillaceae bacterium]
MGIIKILIVDDHPTYREGLSRLLTEEVDFNCIGEASNGFDAVNMVKELQPDVAIVDVSMPDINGIETTKRIKATRPETAVLMISAFDYQSYILSSLQVGASGYMSKDRPFSEIAAAIRLVNKGDSVLDIKATDKVIASLVSSDNNHSNNVSELNSREMDVIRLASRGMSNKDIALTLIVSERTVQTHLVNIYKKLKVNSRTQAIIAGLRLGWLTIDD